jgi:ribosomal protein S18 acetylase RimI-like enzyme
MLDAKSTSPQNRAIIKATIEHKLEISRFLNQENPTHRHLDWFSPLDWLGQQPYLLEKYQDHIQAVMLSAPEVKGATWLRLFSAENTLSIQDTWDRLLAKTILMLKDLNITQFAALSFSNWFKDLLLKANFFQHNTIVVLEWNRDQIDKEITAPHINIRPMRPKDLPEIEHIDHLAFSSLWQNSLSGLTKAYKQPGICTVATDHDRIIGYQISTVVTIQGHLARLAVHPEHQRQGVASALVLDLLERLVGLGAWCITVNTQSDNNPSLALYEKFGFKTTPETIPVYLFQV